MYKSLILLDMKNVTQKRNSILSMPYKSKIGKSDCLLDDLPSSGDSFLNSSSGAGHQVTAWRIKVTVPGTWEIV